MKTLEELKAIRDKQVPQLIIRKERLDITKIIVYMSTTAIAAGAREVLSAFADELAAKNVLDAAAYQKGAESEDNDVKVDVVTPDGEKVTYVNITPEKAVKIVNEHIINKNAVAEYMA